MARQKPKPSTKSAKRGKAAAKVAATEEPTRTTQPKKESKNAEKAAALVPDQQRRVSPCRLAAANPRAVPSTIKRKALFDEVGEKVKKKKIVAGPKHDSSSEEEDDVRGFDEREEDEDEDEDEDEESVPIYTKGTQEVAIPKGEQVLNVGPLKAKGFELTIRLAIRSIVSTELFPRVKFLDPVHDLVYSENEKNNFEVCFGSMQLRAGN